MVRGLILERSYCWTVQPAGLQGSIRYSALKAGLLRMYLTWLMVSPW